MSLVTTLFTKLDPVEAPRVVNLAMSFVPISRFFIISSKVFYVTKVL